MNNKVNLKNWEEFLNESIIAGNSMVNKFKNEMVLNEKSIERIKHWMYTKDIAGISAFRERLTDVTENTHIDRPIDTQFTKSENKKRNGELKSALLKLGYGVTKITGSYLEGGNETVEESFFVVNLNDDFDFKEKLFKLSEYYNQDSFLFKEKNSEEAFLIGTNDHFFPGYGESISQGKFHEKVNAKYMSRLGSTGFTFTKNDEDNPIQDHTPMTFGARKEMRVKKQNLNEIFTVLNIRTFSHLENMGKYLCDVSSKNVLKFILGN